MSEQSEKCPISQNAYTYVYVYIIILKNSPESKHIQFTVTLNRGKQQILKLEKLQQENVS